MAYTGPSIVDYLSSTGKDSSFSARKLLAEQMGVQNYTGTGNQNTQLLTSLRHLLTKPETAPQEQRTLQPASEMQNESRLLNVPDPNAGYNPPPQQPSMPSPTPINTPTKPVDLFNKTLEEMMKAAQSSNNEDLMSKRNAIIQARFNAGRETTPEELRVLSPQAQSSLRNLNQSGLEDQLSGVNTAIQGREAKLKNEQTAKQGILDALLKKQQLDAPAKENLPSSVQEYEYAKKNGFQGSFTDYQNADANRKINVARSTNDSQGLVDTIIQNPGLFEQLTATEKARVAPALQQAGFSNFGKPLSDTAIKEISQSESALNNLADLRQKVKDNISYIGPISGLSALNPYSKAKQIQSDIDRIRQNVGKALEGGVLRKEDEEKYKKILATLNDTPETALYKIDQLIQSIQRDVENYKNNQKLGGRNISSSNNDPLGLGFNQPLSMGKNGLNTGFKAGADVAKIASAIGQFESGGRYSAVGPDTGNGNKALGKYQVMASNVPSWTKEALGKSLTPQQFLNSPEAQDAVAHYKMDQYYKKYGTVEDVASVWFSGRPVSKAGNAKDVIGTSVPKYISNVRAIYDRLG